jgi:glycosyltransferase involved in cell wall biosynthesis
MKIIFLCGSLEPGKDGVGDYTRRLVAELIRQGHQCGIIAIMDKDVQETIKETQDCEHINIPVLRLPFKKGFVLNCQEAKNWLDIFNPEWISLQYVLFSFHPKGLPFGLSRAIQQLTKGRKLHVMFHELWVGMNREASNKHRLWGGGQQRLLKNLVTKLQSNVIHTHTTLYQNQLLKLGISATQLPLFGNIPVIQNLTTKKSIDSGLGQKIFTIVLFGSIHYGAPIEAFAASVSKYAHDYNLDVEIVFIGRCGTALQQWIAICEANNLTIKILGEQPAAIISEVLRMADLGVSTTPLLLAEKSGTVAAMQEHGLPVLCVCRLWEVKDFPTDYTPFGIQLFKEGDLSHYLSTKNEKVVINSVSKISIQFLNSLLKFK